MNSLSLNEKDRSNRMILWILIFAEIKASYDASWICYNRSEQEFKLIKQMTYE